MVLGIGASIKRWRRRRTYGSIECKCPDLVILHITTPEINTVEAARKK